MGGQWRAPASTGALKVPIASRSCTTCQKTGAEFRCAGCKSFCYCCQACQNENWREHKATCKILRRKLEAEN